MPVSSFLLTLVLVSRDVLRSAYGSCEAETSSLGSGYCQQAWNTEECEFDGGDCCECTCEDSEDFQCGPFYHCIDPEATCFGDPGSNPYPDCQGDIGNVGNGFCGYDENTEECGWDGGDCCECTCEDEDFSCGPTYQCIDPTASCFGEEGSNPYPDCQGDIGRVGNGFCGYDENTEECGWDGGDCCECTCQDEDYICSDNTFDLCRDTAAPCFEEVEGSLIVSTCDFDSSDDTILFYTCSGGPYCEIAADPKKSSVFDSTGETQELIINVDVEPTTLVISKPEGTDSWCVDEIVWENGENLLAPSTVIYLDHSDGNDENCAGGILDVFEDSVPGSTGPCVPEWRFFNLQGDDDYEYDFKVQGCDGVDTPPVTVSFCPDLSCNTSDVMTQTFTDFEAGMTTFGVQVDFNPVAMTFLASEDDEWCADAMSFNQFDLAESYPYRLQPAATGMVSNIQYHGLAPGPALTPAPSRAGQEDDEDVWFEAAWEIAVTIVGGIALAGIVGGAGFIYRRWRRSKQVVQEDAFPRASFTTAPAPPAHREFDEVPFYDDRPPPPPYPVRQMNQ